MAVKVRDSFRDAVGVYRRLSVELIAAVVDSLIRCRVKYGQIVMAMRATYKNARISAQKVRPLADLVRGKYADEALTILQFQPNRGARMLEKVIRSAVGNAQDPDQNGGRSYNIEELVLVDVRVDGGPMFKRIRPRARGMAFMIKKRTSHISIGIKPLEDL